MHIHIYRQFSSDPFSVLYATAFVRTPTKNEVAKDIK